jgi:WD40 repeat protein
MRIRWKMLFGFATIVVVYLGSAGPVAARKSSDWSPPVLVPNVNSEFGENGPAISRDGRSLYFSSNRPGGFGNQDIWVSRRARVKDPWGAPFNLGPTINTTAIEAVPAFSRDGHWMFFNTDRPGGSGLQDLWRSYRSDTRDDLDWETPENLGPNINSSFNDVGAGYFANKQQDDVAFLFFGSTRPPSGPMPVLPELYVSAQNSDGSFGPPTLLAELNSSCADQRPSIRADGLEIFFFSNRPAPGGTVCATTVDLWVAKRHTRSQVWHTPENLGTVVNGPSNDQQPYIASDGRTLYFASDRPGGLGLFDLYVTTRNKGRPGGDDHDDDR